ncbi:MAG TPA: FeoA domain-containing protein, partial [bacterium]|nr:FeoA domain-containing protein [bacterium]
TMAHDREHTVTLEEIADLAHRLGNPLYDPHGDPIPTESGEISPPLGSPIATFAVGDAVAVTHLEDEPPELYSQLVAEEIYPGMQMRILEKTDKRLRFVSQEDEHVLSPEVAALITVRELPKEDKPEVPHDALSSLRIGEAARVLSLSPKCRGLERRRLMDLGIVPGTVLQAELENPLGTPIAYRVRGTLIALREELAHQIAIERIREEA